MHSVESLLRSRHSVGSESERKKTRESVSIVEEEEKEIEEKIKERNPTTLREKALAMESYVLD
jgi:hypothetical protein